jgi:formylglycine-generating enzyme required for sulfatase activity/tRNA A-37 threonylcarbamoyl transferase component Bud32
MVESVLRPGTVFGGDFEIIELLASGGMGAVYVAKQRSTGATRAVKTMHAHLTHDDDFRRRFAQEATIGTLIASEHVVQVLAAGIDEEHETPWIAMEFLRGEHLEAYVERKGRLSLGELLELYLQVGHALAAAHRAGIVHRDLKPENVFVSPSQRVGESFTVKILDFGIAKMRSSGDAAAKHTSALGTPLWMAPEQLRMTGDIDARADVWALGLIAFYCLTGKSYWRAAAEPTIDLAALVNEVAYGTMTNANVRASELGAPGMATPVREWFESCVNRDREARYRDGAEAIDALLLASKKVEGFSATLTPGSVTGRAIAQAVSMPPLEKTTLGSAGMGAKRPISPVAAAIGLMVIGGVLVAALARIQPAAGTAPVSPAASSIPVGGGAPAARAAEERVAVNDGSPMISFEGGTMVQGRNDGPTDEGPAHTVSVAAFRIDAQEVTVAQYASCVARRDCTPAGTDEECNAGRAGRERHPINCVDFDQAAAYCASTGERLPTEEEWEFAAREGGPALFPWGPSAPTRDSVCFKRGEGTEGTCPVGSHPAGRSKSGVDDLAGNVWEWTDTAYCTYDRADCNTSHRVARGGSYASESGALVTATARMAYPMHTRGATIGFRCAKTR